MDVHIDVIYYHEMYNYPVCWRTASDVDEALADLPSKSAKLHALKENIRIRVVGFAWSQFHHPWSKNGREYTTNELALHLKKIIAAESSLVIPKEPPIQIPQRKALVQLGTQSLDLKALDDKFSADSSGFHDAALSKIEEREAKGEGDRRMEFQDFRVPDISTLIGKKIDVLCEYDLDSDLDEELDADLEGETVPKETTAMRWCQGMVIDVLDGKNMFKGNNGSRRKYKPGEAVMVLWDAIPELDQPPCESAQVLLRSKWNKQVIGSWRMNIEIDRAASD